MSPGRGDTTVLSRSLLEPGSYAILDASSWYDPNKGAGVTLGKLLVSLIPLDFIAQQ